MSSERGAAAVEMALVMVLFYSMIFGIAYSAVLVFGWNTAAFAARKATRYAMVHGSSSPSPCSASDIQKLVREINGLQSANVTTTWSPNNSAGGTVKVLVSMPVSVFVPLVSIKSITVASSSQMTVIQ